MILHGDCRQQLATLPDCSVDAIVTDPPYELGFMGKKWDASGIAYDPDVWSECLRVLKPGGHLLAFGGTRTYHRMTVAIEDAGFEIRDSLHWLYGSGFPKSLDVSKAIDKARYDRADIYLVTAWIRSARDANGITNKEIDDAFGFNAMAYHWTSPASQPRVPTLDQVPTLLEVLGLSLDDVPDDIRTLLWDLNGRKGQPGENWWKREIVGPTRPGAQSTAANAYGAWGDGITPTIAATNAARIWTGWGTALKPAHEPIVLARKPLSGTVAANVLEYGTGALNIDACRVGGGPRPLRVLDPKDTENNAYAGRMDGSLAGGSAAAGETSLGRWPANIILTHSPKCEQVAAGTSVVADKTRGRRPGHSIGETGGDRGDPMPNGPTYVDTPSTWNCVPGCPVALLNEQSGERPGGAFPTQRGKGVATGFGAGQPTTGGARSMGDSGGASRFFTTTESDADIDVPFLYVAKPSRKERNAGLDGMPEKRPDTRSAAGMGTFDEKPVAQQSNFHPTVKPVALMRHLIRLVTPPGGTVLDPFLGSGTTAVAAILEGFDWIGCELTDDYLPIIEARTTWAEQNRPEPDLTLFTEQP